MSRGTLTLSSIGSEAEESSKEFMEHAASGGKCKKRECSNDHARDWMSRTVLESYHMQFADAYMNDLVLRWQLRGALVERRAAREAVKMAISIPEHTSYFVRTTHSSTVASSIASSTREIVSATVAELTV